MKCRQSQKGSVLIISLLLLIVMTILGISSMNNTVMEERMAGNMYQQNLAFQNAESALREAEANLLALSKADKPEPKQDGTTGVWVKNCPHASGSCASSADSYWWQSIDWETWVSSADDWPPDGSSSGIFSHSDSGIDGYYLIEYDQPVCDSAALGQQSDQQSCQDYYKITALGRGPGGRSEILLQSTFSRRF